MYKKFLSAAVTLVLVSACQCQSKQMREEKREDNQEMPSNGNSCTPQGCGSSSSCETKRSDAAPKAASQAAVAPVPVAPAASAKQATAASVSESAPTTQATAPQSAAVSETPK